MGAESASSQLQDARAALRRIVRWAKIRAFGRGLLARLRGAGSESAREALVMAIGEGLRAMPVPLVGPLLARTVEKTLQPNNQGPDLEQLLDELERMQASDQGFEEGLRHLNIDVDQLRADLATIRETQIGTEFKLADVETRQKWPASDNQISGLLVNRGGGLVVLKEIHLEVEEWEPINQVALSIPAAPLQVIELKATLDTDTRTYPLFELNGEGPHQFSSGLGGERIEIDLDSRQNARYSIRLRFVYYDERADATRELVWPGLGQPAAKLDFPWAPGWGRAEDLLDGAAVLADAEARLEAFADWMEHGGDNRDELGVLGIDAWVADPPSLESFATTMARAVGNHPQATQGASTATERLQAIVARRADHA